MIMLIYLPPTAYPKESGHGSRKPGDPPPWLLDCLCQVCYCFLVERDADGLRPGRSPSDAAEAPPINFDNSGRNQTMTRKILSAVLLFVAALSLSAGAFAEEKTYINGIDFGFPPFGYVDKEGKPMGFDVESVNWIAEKMGFKVKHQPMDWDGIIPALESKKIDLIASGMSATAERAKIVNFTIPYYQVTQVMVVKDDNGADLKTMLTSGKKIGVQRGTVTGKLLEELVKDPAYKFELASYDSTDLAMEDLKIGRIDGSGMDSSIAKEVMTDKPFKIAGTFDAAPENYGYAVRKGDKELLEKLNKGLEMLMKDPYWETLKKKYGI
jgi:polar amino acid transport system substrate-binding protein